MIVILANGDFPRHPIPLGILEKAQKVVCCDGAAGKLLGHGRIPDVVIGDLDSLPPELKGRAELEVIHVSEQETNDLSKAFRHCRANGYDELTILGGTGLREDHTLGNISLLSQFYESCQGISMVTDYGRFVPFSGRRVFHTRVGQQVSVFALSPVQTFESRGLKYPLNGMTMPYWWCATLNEAQDDEISIEVSGNGPAPLVYLVH